MPEQAQLSDEQKKEQERLAEETRLEEERKKVIPQTELPEDPRIKALDNKMDSISSTLQELIRLNAQNVPRAVVEQPKAPDLPTNKEVWDDPVAAISKIIAAQNAPLNKIATELAGDRKLTQVKEQLRLSPQYKIAKERYPDFELVLDSQLGQVPANQLSIQAAGFVMNSVVGSLALSAPVDTRPANPGNPNPANAMPSNVPAHLRPSSPAVPQKKVDDSEPELNENELILARRYGMTPKEYKAMQGGDRMVINPLDAGKGA